MVAVVAVAVVVVVVVVVGGGGGGGGGGDGGGGAPQGLYMHFAGFGGGGAWFGGGIENAYPLSRAHLRPQKGVLKKHTPYLGRICVCVSVFLSVSARLGVPKVRVKGGRHENDAFYAGRAAGKPRIL